MNEKQAKSSEKIRISPKDQYFTKTPIQGNNANANAKKIISTSPGVINNSYSNTPTRMMMTECDENIVKKN